MAAYTTEKHVQAKFFTKQDRFSVPDVPYSVPSRVQVEELDSLINSILKETNNDWTSVAFDFLVNGEFLRSTLGELLETKGITTESVVEVEYVEKQHAPSPEKSMKHDDWVSAVQGSDQWILSGCYDNTIHVWDTNGSHLLTIPGHVEPVKDVKWISHVDDKSTFVSASQDQTAMIWEWNSETNAVECVHVCRGHERSVDCVAVDQAGARLVTGSWDKNMKIWLTASEDSGMNDDDGDGQRKRVKTDTGKASLTRTPIMTLSGHHEAVSSVLWTDAYEVCSASWDHTLRLWDIEMGAMKSQLVGTKAFFGADYSHLNRHIISASADRHVRLWDPRVKDGTVVKSAFTSHTAWVTCVSWSTTLENLFISGSHDKCLKVWDWRSVKVPLYDMPDLGIKILCCDWSNPKYILSGSADNRLRIFSI